MTKTPLFENRLDCKFELFEKPVSVRVSYRFNHETFLFSSISYDYQSEDKPLVEENRKFIIEVVSKIIRKEIHEFYQKEVSECQGSA